MNLIRIAKLISDRGYCSRRNAEKLISLGVVFADGNKVCSPSEKFQETSEIIIDGNVLDSYNAPRIWLYYKPIGLITTHFDPQNRPTVFENLPINFDKKIISVGRLDINSEGLLLLTNSGKVARYFELPHNNMERSYKVRAFGKFSPDMLTQIQNGLTVEGIKYKPARIKILKEKISFSNNNWFIITLKEGKNREIRKIFEYFGLQVNKLIRISYGPYHLGNMKPGEILTGDLSDLLPTIEAKEKEQQQ